MTRFNKSQLALLRSALKSARLENCGVAKEHQEAMKLYLDTWVCAKLEVLLDEQEGRVSAERVKRSAALLSA